MGQTARSRPSAPLQAANKCSVILWSLKVLWVPQQLCMLLWQSCPFCILYIEKSLDVRSNQRVAYYFVLWCNVEKGMSLRTCIKFALRVIRGHRSPYRACGSL